MRGIMKHHKLFFTLLLGFLLSILMLTESNAQIFSGNLTLGNQAEVDAFNYTEVTGNLLIQESVAGNITNLNGLSSLTSVGENFRIENNTALTNIDGLFSLTTVGTALIISDNDALTNIDGLSSLTSVNTGIIWGVLAILNNAALTEFCGLYTLFSPPNWLGLYLVAGNAFNAFPQDIINGGACIIIPQGTISGSVTVNSIGLENALVKLLDEIGLPVDDFDDVNTDANGEYSFVDVPVGDYQVMIVVPLGYASDGDQKTTTVIANENSTVDFDLTEIVVVNAARSKGYWKHQFDVYVKGRGHAQESEQDLIDYIDEVDERYNSLSLFNLFDGMTDGEDDFEEWQDVLSVKGNEGMVAKATAQLAALLLNIMSLKIAQYEIVTVDGKTAGDVLIFTSELIEDGDDTNDELAKDLAESVNNQQTIAAGIVPEGNILFKTGTELGEVITYELYNSYPNPFNPATTIKYQTPNVGFVTLKVYDVLGNEVTTLVNERKEEGRYQITFDASALSSGVYIYQMRINDFIDTKKMILMK